MSFCIPTKLLFISLLVLVNGTFTFIGAISGVQQSNNNFNFYSQDLLSNLFSHPYTKIEFLANDLKVSRQTAAN